MYNLHSILHFGKHNNMPIWAITVCEPDYIEWCIKNVDAFCIENLEGLQLHPLFGFGFMKYPDVLMKRISENKELYNSGLPEKFYANEYLKIKGYEFYLENLLPFLDKFYTYSEAAMQINNNRTQEQIKRQLKENKGHTMEYDSWDSSEKYTFDDTINDAFEGDFSNYWNVD